MPPEFQDEERTPHIFKWRAERGPDPAYPMVWDLPDSVLSGSDARPMNEIAAEKPFPYRPRLEHFGIGENWFMFDGLATVLDRIVARYYDPTDPIMVVAWDLLTYIRKRKLHSKRLRVRRSLTIYTFDAYQHKDGTVREFSVRLPHRPAMRMGPIPGDYYDTPQERADKEADLDRGSGGG